MALQVEIVGLDDFVRDAEKMGANVRPLMQATLVNAGSKIQSNVRIMAPHRTGTLQRSVLLEKDNLEVAVRVNEKYGNFIEHGTGIFGETGQPIRPKSKRALAFTSGGMNVVVKSVKGMKAKPFFKPGVEHSIDYVQEQFIKLTERIVHGLAGR